MRILWYLEFKMKHEYQFIFFTFLSLVPFYSVHPFISFLQWFCAFLYNRAFHWIFMATLFTTVRNSGVHLYTGALLKFQLGANLVHFLCHEKAPILWWKYYLLAAKALKYKLSLNLTSVVVKQCKLCCLLCFLPPILNLKLNSKVSWE